MLSENSDTVYPSEKKTKGKHRDVIVDKIVRHRKTGKMEIRTTKKYMSSSEAEEDF